MMIANILRTIVVVAIATVGAGASSSVSAAIGRTQGSVTTSGAGEANYSIPIFAPPGTHDIHPRVAFAYAHRSGNGLLGNGWSLAGLSTIQRCRQTLAQDGQPFPVTTNASDKLCLDGKRLRQVGGSAYGQAGAEYRTEIESFARIRGYGTAGTGTAYFEVETKDGLIHRYGATADSAIEASGSSTVRVWALSSTRDRSGNEMRFTYAEDNASGAYRPAAIQWTSNAAQSLSAAYSMQFVYEARPDVTSGFVGGYRVVEGNRLDRVDVFFGSSLVRRYELTYDLSSAKRSRVTAIQECAGAGGADCLAATTVAWQSGAIGLGDETNVGSSVPVFNSSLIGTMPIDVNGDGHDDYVYPHIGTGSYWIAFGNNTGYGQAFNTGISYAGTGSANYEKAMPLDYNSDGRMDLMLPNSGNNWRVLLSTGMTFSIIDTAIPASSAGGDAMTGDVNGDGRPDLIWTEYSQLKVRFHNGSGFSATPTTVYTLPGTYEAYSAYGQTMMGNPGWVFRSDIRNADFDGDGRTDLLLRYGFDVNEGTGPPSWVYRWHVLISRGSSYVVGAELGEVGNEAFVADVNGDGLSDVIRDIGNFFDGYSWYLYLGRGDGGFSAIGTGIPFSSHAGASWLTDWDGDGRADLVQRNLDRYEWYRWNGTTFDAAQQTGLVEPSSSSTAYGPIKVSDVNGDGMSDWTYIQPISNTLRFRLRSGAVPDLAQTVTDGFGNAVTFSYASIAQGNYTKHADAAFPEVDFSSPLQVVSGYISTDGAGSAYAVTFSYEGARTHLQGRGFEGFASKSTWDSRDQLYVFDLFQRTFPYTGMPVERRIAQSAGPQSPAATVARTTSLAMALTYGSGNDVRFFPYQYRSTTTDYEVGGTFNAQPLKTTVIDYTVDSATGTTSDTVSTTTEAATGNGSYPGQSLVLRTYHSSLFTDVANWCLGRPEVTQQIGSHSMPGGAQITRQTNTTWEGAKCRPTQTVIEPGDSLWRVTTDLGYDGFGNVNLETVTPAAGQGQAVRTTATGWGATGQFPMSVTNPKSQTTTFGWDLSKGLRTSVTDPNNLTVSQQFDNFGRLTREQRPDGTATDFYLTACSAGCAISDANVRTSLMEVNRNTSNGEITRSYHYSDALDRETWTQVQVFGGGYSTIRKFFNARGLLARETTPYLSGDPIWNTTYSYDALGRPTLIQRPTSEADPSNHNTQFSYEGLQVAETDALGHSTTKRLDAAGRIVQVLDAAGSDTDYEYDAFGNLLKTHDFYGNQTVLTYNNRGMKMTSSDPDMGAWVYNYYPLGELKTQTNAKGQLVTFTYDALSRILTRTEPEGVTTFTYDTATKGIGQLASVASPGGYAESYSYDSVGRASLQSITIDAVTHQYEQTYNSATGLLETITYPTAGSGARFKVRYDYQYGLMQSVRSYTNNVAGTVYWRTNAMNARGQLIDEQLGNGLQTISSYDRISGWLDSRTTGTSAGSDEQNFVYTWDKAGNLRTRQDLNQSLVESFYYDNLDRLDYSQLGGTTNLNVDYDAIGNITNKSGVGAYTYHATKRHAVVAAGTNTYVYDGNGNMTSRNGASTTWYSYDLPNTINNASGTSATFFYGPSRQRYKQLHQSWSDASSPRVTQYVGELFEIALENDAGYAQTLYRHYIMAEGKRIAVGLKYTEPGYTYAWTSYYLQDHLGSLDGLYPDDEDVSYRYSNDAFGKRRGSHWTGAPTADELDYLWSDTSNRGLTDHEHLDNVGGLIHMNGRVYDSVIGRFTSADPFVQAPYVGQSLNRYSYVMNNPLRYTDPSGFASSDLGCGGKPCNVVPPGDDQVREVTVTAKRIWNSAFSGSHRTVGTFGDYMATRGGFSSNDGISRSTVGGGGQLALNDRVSLLNNGYYESVGIDIGQGMTLMAPMRMYAALDPTAAAGLEQAQEALGYVAGGILIVAPGPEDAVVAGVLAVRGAMALVRVGDRLTTVFDILKNPSLLAGKNPAQVSMILGRTPGWATETLGRGSHAGQGYVLREYNAAGNATGRMIQWHPGGGHHGANPYWRVRSPEGGISTIIPGGAP